MEINYTIRDRELTVFLMGELDHHAAKEVMNNIEQYMEQHLPAKIFLDFAGVTFMDSSGIAVVIRAKRCAQLVGGNLEVINVPRQAGRVLETAGVERLVALRYGGER